MAKFKWKYCMLKVNTPSRRCEEIMLDLFKLIIIPKTKNIQQKAVPFQFQTGRRQMLIIDKWKHDGLQQQELIVILMKVDIPIIITRNGHKGGIFGFKLASPQLLRQLNLAKNSTSLNPRLTIQGPKHHQTLSTNQMIPRTRRISSSAAAKRFPKDFFKDENCFHPIKSLKTQHKQYDQSFMDSFNAKSKLIRQQIDNQRDKHKKGTQTPNFKQKIQLSVGNKTQVTDYVSWEKMQSQQIKNNLKKNVYEKLNKRGPIKQISPLQQSQKNQQPLNLISNFNLTLGQKINIALIMKKENRDKRKKALCQKQNILEEAEDNLVKGKSLRGEMGFRIRRKI